MIAMFAGEQYVPPLWHICNGQNGTVDLRDKFVIAAGSKFSAGSTGGSLKIGINNMPSHSHGGATGNASADHVHDMGAQQVTLSGGTTGAAGGHSHGVSDPGHSHTYGTAPMKNMSTGGDRTNAWASGSNPQPEPQVPTSHSGTGIGIQGVGDHTHTISGTATITGNTGGMSAQHQHAIGVEGGGADYIQPYYALVFAQYTGAQ